MKCSKKHFGSNYESVVEGRWYIYFFIIVLLGAFMFSFGGILSRQGNEYFKWHQKYGEEAYQKYVSEFEHIDAQITEIMQGSDVSNIKKLNPAIRISFHQEGGKNIIFAQNEDVLLEYELTDDEENSVKLKYPPMSYEAYNRIVTEKLNQIRVEMWALSTLLMILGLFEILFFIILIKSVGFKKIFNR